MISGWRPAGSTGPSDCSRPCRRGPDHGYLAYLEATIVLDTEGDPEPARRTAAELSEMAMRFGDPVLGCFALVLSGAAAVREGRTRDGFGDLDEAMLPVLAGHVPPLWGGDIYCSVIHLCEGLGDLARMRAWTDALDRWAAPLSETFMYRRGDPDPPAPAASLPRVTGTRWSASWGSGARAWWGRTAGWPGAGYYELGEVRRLRGQVGRGQEAYDAARRLGVDPQPGEALLQRARAGPAAALAALRASLGESGRLERAGCCARRGGARAGSRRPGIRDDVGRRGEATAEYYGTPGLVAGAAHARALVAARRSRDPRRRSPHLEQAAQIYRDQRYRYASRAGPRGARDRPSSSSATNRRPTPSWPARARSTGSWEQRPTSSGCPDHRAARGPHAARGRGAGLRRLGCQQP